MIHVIITKSSDDAGIKKISGSTDSGGGRVYSIAYKSGLTAGDVVNELKLAKVALIFLDNKRISLNEPLSEGVCLKILDSMSCGG